MNIDELKAQRAKLDAEIAAAEQRRALMTPEEYFASLLHETLCHSNHVDGCSWQYEAGWSTGAHADYLSRAKKIMESDALLEVVADSANPDFAITFIKLVRMAQGRRVP